MPADATGNRPVIVFSLLFMIFFTLSLIRYVFVVFAVWSLAFGVAFGFILTSNFTEVPNLLAIFLPSEKTKKRERKKSTHGCNICGKDGCGRHRPDMTLQSQQPWVDLYIPERVDKALTEFLEILLRTHVYDWYWDLSHDQSFVDEIRKNLRFVLATICNRVMKTDLTDLVLTKVLRKFAMHLDCYQKTKERVIHGEDIQTVMMNRLGPHRHFAVQNETTEADYLRYMSENLIPLLLPYSGGSCRSLNTLLREILTNIILLPVVEKFADPDFVNQLLVVLLDEEPLAEMIDPPSDPVLFLEEFAKPRKPKTDSPLTIAAFDLIHDQTLLFFFMQFMKRAAAVNVLQFCLDVEDFNKRSLAYDLREDQKAKMLDEAQKILNTYFVDDAVDKINFPRDVVEDFKLAISSPEDGMMKLKTAAPLFRAFEHAFNILEDVYMPMFHHSSEFYQIQFGDRSPIKQEQLLGKSSRFMRLADVTKIAQKIRQKKKFLKDDRSLAIFLDENEPITPPEVAEEYDEEPDLGPDIFVDEAGDIHDLSYWHITIPRVDSIFERGKKVYVFVVLVDSIGTQGGIRTDDRWHVMRKYNEFYVLDSKLRRFHEFLPVTELPPKRTILKKDLEYLNSCKIRFQEYLQGLVRHQVLRGSGLLHSFLSPGHQITGMFEPESMGKEAGRKIKSISSKFVLERGQNLESFLQSFLVSAEPPLKKRIPPRTQVEKGTRVNKQKVNSKIFLPPPNWAQHPAGRDEVDGATLRKRPQCLTEHLVYFARTLFEIPEWLHHVLTGLKFFGQATIDAYVTRYLSYKIGLATSETQLVTLIHLVRDAIFFDSDPPRTDSQKLARRDETLEKMLKFLPDTARSLTGEDNHDRGIKIVFEMLQNPKLNKQLLFVLLDVILLELFPELDQASSK